MDDPRPRGEWNKDKYKTTGSLICSIYAELCWKYAENMLKLEGHHFPVKEGKEKKQIKNSNFIISGEAPDQRMPPPANFCLLRPWVDYQKTRCSWVLVHRPSYNQVDLRLSSILGESSIFKPIRRTCEHFYVYTQDKSLIKIWQRSPDWFFWNLELCFPLRIFFVLLFFLKPS